MKTDKKTQPHRPKPGGPGGQKGGQNRRKNSFFRDVPKSENKAFQPQHRKDGGAAGGKRGPGVQKTVGFKPKHHGPNRHGKDGGGGGGGKKHAPGGGHNQQRYNNHNNNNSAKKGQHGYGRKPAAKNHPAPPIQFNSKPEKINYCLAPDRLDAQSRAIKQFEREEREQAIEQKKLDRQQKHKMMTQKTRKGQPVMQGRLELLFEKVKKVVGAQ